MTQINLIFAADLAFCYRTSNAQKKKIVLNVNFIVLAKAPEYLETASTQLCKQSKRCVEPIGLVFYAFAWHLIAWCELRNEYRDFRVERISRLKLLERPFAKAKHIQIGEYMKVLPVDY